MKLPDTQEKEVPKEWGVSFVDIDEPKEPKQEENA